MSRTLLSVSVSTKCLPHDSQDTRFIGPQTVQVDGRCLVDGVGGWIDRETATTRVLSASLFL